MRSCHGGSVAGHISYKLDQNPGSDRAVTAVRVIWSELRRNHLEPSLPRSFPYAVRLCLCDRLGRSPVPTFLLRLGATKRPAKPKHSLSNPRALGAAPPGAARYNLPARAMDSKPFQCGDGRNPPQRRRSAARAEQEGLFKFTLARARSSLEREDASTPSARAALIAPPWLSSELFESGSEALPTSHGCPSRLPVSHPSRVMIAPSLIRVVQFVRFSTVSVHFF